MAREISYASSARSKGGRAVVRVLGNATGRIGLIRRARIDEWVRIVVGAPIPRARLDGFGADAKQMMDFLRRATYDLSPRPLPSCDYGLEFEEKYRA